MLKIHPREVSMPFFIRMPFSNRDYEIHNRYEHAGIFLDPEIFATTPSGELCIVLPINECEIINGPHWEAFEKAADEARVHEIPQLLFCLPDANINNLH